MNAKKAVKMPVIASINCSTSHEWSYFARKIEEAGADAIELNIFVLPSDLSKSAEDIERIYLEIIQNIKNAVKIPVAVKMGYYFFQFPERPLHFIEVDRHYGQPGQV